MTKPSWQDFGTHDESAFPELWDGVVGAWAPCLGPTGSRLHDMSRRANWGTLTNMDNATDWVLNGGQYALDFDGSNDYAEASPIALTGPFTFSFWMKSGNAAQSNKYIISRAQGGDNDYSIIYGYTSQALEFYSGRFSGTNPRTGSSITIADTDWHHIAYSYRPGEWSGYRDGARVFSVAATFSLTMTAGAFFGLATFAGASAFYLGLLDDVNFWARGLTQNEVRQLYQLGRGGMYRRRRRRAIYLPQAGFQAAWARGSNVLLGFNQP